MIDSATELLQQPVSTAAALNRREREQRRARRKYPKRPRTISVKRTGDEGAVSEHWRPKTRGDCAGVPRPCPFVGCRHSLFLDVSLETGSIRLNFPDLELWEMGESCSLDVADRGGDTLEAVGAVLNVTRERARQIENLARAEFAAHAESLGYPAPLLPPMGEPEAQKTKSKNGYVRKTTGELKHTSGELRVMLRRALARMSLTQKQAALRLSVEESALSAWLNYKSTEHRVSRTALMVERWLDLNGATPVAPALGSGKTPLSVDATPVPGAFRDASAQPGAFELGQSESGRDGVA